MKLDLNNPKEFTLEGVRKLIASREDDRNLQLRVTNSGITYISESAGAESIEDLAFRFVTFDESNGWMGVAASKDDKWVSRVYKAMQKNWPIPSSTHLDFY